MAVLPIVKGKDQKILRTKTQPVSQITEEIISLIEDMKTTMLEAKGVGIAAPQVDVDLRVIICRFNPETDDQKIVAMINPEITWMSEETCIEEEGCLSLPGVYAKVTRPVSIRINFLDEKGREQSGEFADYNSRIIQHEVDHINGILFIDRL